MIPRAAALRRALLAKGLTLKPTCDMCRREVAPKDMRSGGLCAPCKAERDAASEYFDRLNAEADSTAPGVFAVRPGHEAPRPEAPHVLCDWPELDDEPTTESPELPPAARHDAFSTYIRDLVVRGARSLAGNPAKPEER